MTASAAAAGRRPSGAHRDRRRWALARGTDQRSRLLHAIVSRGRRARLRRREDRRDRRPRPASRAPPSTSSSRTRKHASAQAHGALAAAGRRGDRRGDPARGARRRRRRGDPRDRGDRRARTETRRRSSPTTRCSAGPRPRDSHDRLMSHARALGRAGLGAVARRRAGAPDVPARVLLGGATRLLCMTPAPLRPLLARSRCQVLQRWVDCYTDRGAPGSRRERLREHEQRARLDASCDAAQRPRRGSSRAAGTACRGRSWTRSSANASPTPPPR